jgi:hypothetical protein
VARDINVLPTNRSAEFGLAGWTLSEGLSLRVIASEAKQSSARPQARLKDAITNC